MGWLSDYNYRKEITITAQSGAGTNYPIKLLVGQATGLTCDFHVENHALLFPTGKNIGGDLAFASSDQETQLDFWVEKVTGTAGSYVATIWVEVSADLSTSNATIYCYYSKADAVDYSNGVNTFILFDDFDGVALDTSKWNTAGGTVSVGSGKCTITVTSGHPYIQSKTTWSAGVKFHHYTKITPGGLGALGFSDTTALGNCQVSDCPQTGGSTEKLYISTHSGAYYYDLITAAFNSWILYDMCWYSSILVKYFRNGSQIGNTYVDRTPEHACNVHFLNYAGSTFEIDYAIVMKVNASGVEPAFASAGEETTNLFPCSISGTALDINGNPMSGITINLSSTKPDTDSVTTDENGDYIFTDITSSYDITITPSKSGSLFNPESIELINITGDEIDQDFVCYIRTPLRKILFGLKSVIGLTEEIIVYAIRIIQNLIIHGTLTVTGQTTIDSTLTGIIKGTAGVLSAITAGTANQILGINNAGNAYEYKTVEGTSNQVNVALSTANKITLSTPQDIHTGASPTFAGLTIGSLAGIMKSAAGVQSALALGAANTKLFVDAAGTAPEFASGYKIGTITRDTAAIAGDVAYTGIGFKPSNVLFLAIVDLSYKMSIGLDDASARYCIFHHPDNTLGSYSWDNATSIYLRYDTKIHTGKIKTMDSDGFTITWATSGSPTGIAYIHYMAFR